MNERYTYGYSNATIENNAWNIENEYINSLNEVIEDYNNQVKKIEEINSLIANAEVDIEPSLKGRIEETNDFIQRAQEEIVRNNNVTYPTFSDEQIKNWYNEDYPSYNTTITFEIYKANLLRELELSNNINKQNLVKRNEELSKQILEKQEYLSQLNIEKQLYLSNLKDESKANMRYLIDVKNESKKAILKKKNEINLLLSEKRIQLSSILLEQQRTTPKYDDNGNVLNSEELIALRNKYDATWLEIRKLEHTLHKLDEMLALMEYTQSEIELMMRGLNPKQKEIYNNIIDTQIKMDTQEQIQNIEEVKSDVIESVDTETVELVQSKQVAQDNEFNMDEENLKYIEKWAREEAEQIEENRVQAEVKDLNFEAIIRKVCGDTSATKVQSSMYTASKIKVFNKPQLNNLGLMDKITSIGKSVIGIIPKAAMKLYGKLIDTETEEMFQGMENRAMELSDNEVVTIINEYDYNLNLVPKGFEQIVKPRINLYVSKRVDFLQNAFNQAMYEIAFSQKTIEESKDQETLNKAYNDGYTNIKDLIKIEIEVDDLLSVWKIHSFESQLQSLETKLNYAGARFETAKDYDTSLWSRVSGLSQKIEYSLDPKEVVDSYTEREKIYKEHGKHKSYLTESNLEKLNNNIKKEEKVEKVDPTFKKSEEIRSLIEGLKSMKAELTEKEVKEIESLLR